MERTCGTLSIARSHLPRSLPLHEKADPSVTHLRRTLFLALTGVFAAALPLRAQHAAGGDSTAVPAAARAAIDSVNAAWLPALQRGDGAAIAEPYADDGVLVAASGEVTRGRAAIEQVMREAAARGGSVLGGRLVQDGITRAGPMLYEWGHAELEIARSGGQPTHVGGRYLTVWRQDATGRWRIIRNLSLP